MEPEFYAEYFEIEDRHWWFVGRREIFMRLLERHLPPLPNGRPRRILDVGCGTGTMLRHLQRFGSVEGVDADEGAVRFCRERALDAVQRADVPLPFDAGTFDLVTMLDVLEHVDDDRGMLAELHRVLRPGGALLLSVPAYRFLWGPQDEISHHKRRYVAREVRERATEAGYALRRLSYFNTLLFPAIAAIRLLRPRWRAGEELRSDFELTKPGPLNELLGRVFSLEAPVLERMSLPFGVSILALAEKAATGPVSAP
jgi:SAM-dependent methyltransferase